MPRLPDIESDQVLRRLPIVSDPGFNMPGVGKMGARKPMDQTNTSGAMPEGWGDVKRQVEYSVTQASRLAREQMSEIQSATKFVQGTIEDIQKQSDARWKLSARSALQVRLSDFVRQNPNDAAGLQKILNETKQQWASAAAGGDVSGGTVEELHAEVTPLVLGYKDHVAGNIRKVDNERRTVEMYGALQGINTGLGDAIMSGDTASAEYYAEQKQQILDNALAAGLISAEQYRVEAMRTSIGKYKAGRMSGKTPAYSPPAAPAATTPPENIGVPTLRPENAGRGGLVPSRAAGDLRATATPEERAFLENESKAMAQRIESGTPAENPAGAERILAGLSGSVGNDNLLGDYREDGLSVQFKLNPLVRAGVDRDVAATQKARDGANRSRKTKGSESVSANVTYNVGDKQIVIPADKKEIMKTAYDLAKDGKLTPEYVAAARGRVGVDNYKSLLGLIEEGNRTKSETATRVALHDRALAGEDVSADADRAMRDGKLSATDRSMIQGVQDRHTKDFQRRACGDVRDTVRMASDKEEEAKAAGVECDNRIEDFKARHGRDPNYTELVQIKRESVKGIVNPPDQTIEQIDKRAAETKAAMDKAKTDAEREGHRKRLLSLADEKKRAQALKQTDMWKE